MSYIKFNHILLLIDLRSMSTYNIQMKNTNRKKSFYSPTPEEWKALRLAYGLTQTQVGELVCSALRTIQGWENGSRRIPPMAWELLRIKLDVDGKEV